MTDEPVFPQIVLISVACGCRFQINSDSRMLFCGKHTGDPPGKLQAAVCHALAVQMIGLGQALGGTAEQIMATQIVEAKAAPKLILEA